MPEIEIIDKVDVPEGRRNWQVIIESLGYNEAIKLVYPDKGAADNQRNNILANFRRTRLSKSTYRLRSRVTRLATDQGALFIWKEGRI